MGYSDELDSLRRDRKKDTSSNGGQEFARIAVKRVAVPASQVRTLPDGTKIVIDSDKKK